jgi:hypothetical protein
MYFSSLPCKGWKWFKHNFVQFSIENNGGGIIKRNSRHCEKKGGKRWSRAINSVSYRVCWIRKKYSNEGGQAILLWICVAVGVDTTFLFTAYTGSAASLIGGVTISKAAYLNLQRQLNKDDINEWKDVRILVIDGYHSLAIVFWKNSTGNSHELEIGPSCLVDFQSFLQVTSANLNLFVQKNLNFLFSSKSTQQLDQNINAIIILDNKHCFKEDPE